MKIGVQLTLDGLVRALKVRAHDVRAETERRRLVGRMAERDGGRQASPAPGPLEDGDDRARP